MRFGFDEKNYAIINLMKPKKGQIMSLNEIINEALSLKPQDRYMIIENLVQSLNQPNSEIDQLWIEESTKRVQSIKNGTLKTVSYGDVFAL